MKVGVLGSGIVGQVLGTGFAKHGHQVMMGTRNPSDQDVQNWLTKTPGASAGTFADAARFGEVLVLVVLGRVVEKVIELAGPKNFAGKTLMDATNPLADSPPVNGVLPYTTGPNESLGERIQALLPMAHVVKAFNSVGNTRMVNPDFDQGTPTMFLCGDNEAAKAVVSEIISSSAGSPLIAAELSPRGHWSRSAWTNQWTHAFKVLTH